jgi:uncharacterized repeat protein (TIGR01451 family)
LTRSTINGMCAASSAMGRLWGVLLALALAVAGPVASVPVAHAADVTCTSSAPVPPTVRSSGITELVGDVVLVCTGGTSTANGTTVPLLSVQVFLNTNVTSRLLADPAGWSEALLIIDEPPPQSQRVCATANGACSITGKGTGIGIYDGSLARPNVFQGKQSGANSIVWSNIPFDPPGANNRILRITNIRANASGLGVSQTSTQIIESVSSSGLTLNNPTVIVAFVQSAQQVGVFNAAGNVAGPVTLSQCVSQNPIQPFAPTFTLRYSESFGTAWKARTKATYIDENTSPPPAAQNVVGTTYNSESGFFNPAFPSIAGRGDLGTAGEADAGTRILAVFHDVPTGVHLYVPVVVTKTQLVLRLTANDAGDFLPLDADAGALSEVPISASEGQAVYEVLRADPAALESADIHVSVGYVAGTNSPAIGTASVGMAFAPLSEEGAATAGDPVPRFLDDSTLMDAFSISAASCGSQTASVTLRMTAGPERPLPGSTVSYTLTVTNSGTSALSGLVVTTTIPAKLTNVVGQCSASAGATCAAPAGTDGAERDTASIPAGGVVTYIVTGSIPPGLRGTLPGSALATLPFGVPVSGGQTNSLVTPNIFVAAQLSLPAVLVQRPG